MNRQKNILDKIRKTKLMQVLGYISLLIYPLFCLFIMDYLNYGHLAKLQYFIVHHPFSYLFEVAVIYTIFLFLLLVCRKAFVAGGILGLLAVLCAYINYMKLALNGDNFYPKDLVLAGNTGELISFINGALPVYFYLWLVAAVIWIVVLAVLRTKVPLQWFVRLPAAALTVGIVLFLFSTPARSAAVLDKFSMKFFDASLQSSNYSANGFLGAFTLNLLSMSVERPEDYSEDTINEILDGYTATVMDDDGALYDVIVVLSESFFDARVLNGVEYSEELLSNYDEIIARENCYSGKMFSTALNGGTVRPEFDILTGLTTDYLPSGAVPYEYVTASFSTYVSNYKDAGYRTIALHPYDKKFYSRATAYGSLGFDAFYGLEEISEVVDVSYKRGYATDASTLSAIEYYLDDVVNPMFLFAITMQNHQAYTAMDEADITVRVSSDILSDNVMTSLTTYVQGLYDADQMLGDLVDYIDNRETPTILLFFGDHLPNLGANNEAYEQCGLIDTSDGLSNEERMFLYSTPFLIYSNTEIKSGMFENNTGNEISSYHLLNAVAESTGFSRTPYMNLLRDFYDVTPLYNIRLDMEETEEIRVFTRAMRYVTYDRLVGENYTSR